MRYTDKELLNAAIQASLKAGKEILKVYNSDNFNIEAKIDSSPLTIADKSSHQIIMEELKLTALPVLSEEGKDIDYSVRKIWKKYWLVDPLDGTKEFIKRNGEFTVNIALIQDQKPIIGVIYVPVTKELYYSLHGLGALKYAGDAAQLSIEALIRESEKLPLKTENRPYTIVGSRSHMSQETLDFIELIKRNKPDIKLLSRGSSLKICMVAEGRADIYPRFGPTMEWDIAAGHAIAIASGCSIYKANTKDELLYNKENLLNPFFVVERI